MGQLVPYCQLWTPAIRVGLSASLRLCGKLHHGENAGWGRNGAVFCRSAPFGNQNWYISGPVQGGGGTRFPEDRDGVEATRRVKLNGAENENRYKNSTETFRNVRAGWVSQGGMDWLRFRSRRLGTKTGPKLVRYWGGSVL